MKRLLISCAVGFGVLLGALAPTFVPTPASAYYYHHRHYRYHHHHHYYNHRRCYYSHHHGHCRYY